METYNISFQDTVPQASAAPLVESFTLEGLYNYKDVGISSDYAATIIIAQNGSGKTTLLAALDAFLRCQFSRLQDLEFHQIRCRLRGISEELILPRTDITETFEISEASELTRTARRLDIEPSNLINFLERDFNDSGMDYEEITENPVGNILYRHNEYHTKKFMEHCAKLRASYYEKNNNILSIINHIRSATKGIDIVYLPTYRRIELPLNEEEPAQSVYKRRKSKFKMPSNGLYSGDIQFGLADISARLSQLNQKIMIESNISYREISANIINELLDGTFDRQSYGTSEIPDQHELGLFFARLKEGRRRGVQFNDLTIPNIEKIYAVDGLHNQTNKFLMYFLSKLNNAIRVTKEIENSVEHFIRICNKYLSKVDPSTNSDNDYYESYTEIDGKKLVLDRRNLSVHVESTSIQKVISLNSLSSGEKQLVSLFAKLFLYEKEKLILIDEPELSLSIDWQRHLLIDFLTSPQCRQVIAITHSPFVFDNELEPFARSMEVNIQAGPLDLFDEDIDFITFDEDEKFDE